MIYIFNRNEEQVMSLDLEYTFTRELGKFNTLEFETEFEIEKNYRAVIFEDGEPYEFIITDSEYSRDDLTVFNYFCQDAITELQGYPIADKRPSGSYKVAMTSILENTRWKLEAGSSYSEALVNTNSFFRISVLEAFSEIVETYNVEWITKYRSIGTEITERIIIIDKIGTQANSRLEFGKNIIKFERKILPEPIITALYGYGKGEELEGGSYGRRINFADINGGLEYVENTTAKNNYGIGKTGQKQNVYGFFVDEEETDKVKLLESTKKELERLSQVQAEYTVDAANLFIDCKIGDTVPVLDEVINFEGNVRIIKEVREAGDIKFTFGHVQKTFLDSINNDIQKSILSSEIKIISIMETRLNQIADVYFGEDGYNYDLKVGNEYGLPAGLYSFDKPIDQDPTKVIYFGAGKLLIADSKATDGAWAWKTALDGQGIVGSSIVAHSITANKLAADVGQSLDLSSNVSISSIVKTEWEKNSNIVKLDSKMVPIVPYKKGDIWYKDKYNFTQGYDIIKATDTVTLGEFAESGLFRAKVDRPNGTFEWNDWERVSADSQFQISDISQKADEIAMKVTNNYTESQSQYIQLSNMIATTVKQADLLTEINQQAGNILLKASADGKTSKLNLTANGTEIENALIKDAHISTLNVSKITGDIATFVKTSWNAINSNLTVDGNQLVFSHTDGTMTVLDATGLYTKVGTSKYMHSYLTYANHYFKLNAPVTAPIWVTLPPIWKGRKFDVFVSIASTAGMNTLGNESVIRNISVGHVENTRDYVNGRFQLYGICEYFNTSTKAKGTTWVDVRYLVQQIF